MQRILNAQIVSSVVARGALLVCMLLAAVPLCAQWLNYPTPGIPRTADGKPNLSAPAPKTADGRLSVEGIWLRVRGPNAPASNPAGLPGSLTYFMPKDAEIPMQAWAEELFKQRAAKFGAGRPSQRCLPHGIPDAMLYGGPMKIAQGPNLTIILYEEFNHFRQVFTDGRPLPDDPQPSWFGYSVARWEGDAFVIETVGFNEQTWLDDTGHPHTDAMRTIERFRRPDFGHLELEVTIDDPKAYTRPWSANIRFNLLADTELLEDICENEKDNARIEGLYK